MEDIWEQDNGNGLPFEEYERQQKKDMVTIDAFVQPTKISIRGPTSKQQQQEPLKKVPFEKHYTSIYNQYINEKFEHLHQEEFPSCNTQSSGEESGDEDSISTDGGGARKRKRSSRDSFSIEKRPKKFDASHPYECFLCGWGDIQHDSIEAEHIILMLNIINVNRGIHSNSDISLQVHQYFMEEVYDPESGMDILTPEIVYDHLVGIHSLDASLYIAERIRKRKQYLFVLEQNLVLEDGSIDHKVMDHINKNESITLELYGKKPSTMMFGNGNGAEDMKRQANSVALLPKMEKVSTRKSHRRVIL